MTDYLGMDCNGKSLWGSDPDPDDANAWHWDQAAERMAAEIERRNAEWWRRVEETKGQADIPLRRE